jgi:hypothetical protein
MASERLYMIANSSRATTAAPVKQPTGTAIRTMLQFATPTTDGIKLVEWGCSFDGSSSATPIQVELFNCTGAATMSTASVAADAMRLSAPLGTETVPMQVGTTSLTGFATAAVTEGTVANYNMWDLQLVAPTSQYVKQFPLGREPEAALSTFVRIRVTAGASVNMYCYLVFGTC